MQRLPRELRACESAHAISQVLAKTSKSILWPGGTLPVGNVVLSDVLANAIGIARRAGKLHGGLENIQTLLQREEAGLTVLKQRRQLEKDLRVSRLVLISNDGSERFYRACESLLFRHQDRVLGLKLNVSGTVLGERFFGKESFVKIAMVGKSAFVARALQAIVEAATQNQTGSSLQEQG